MHNFVAKPSRWRMALLGLGAVGFVVLGVWIAGLLGNPPKPGREWAGLLAIVFFGLCTLMIGRRLFDTEDQVRIDAQGIVSKQWSAQTIPWSAIADISVWEYRHQKSIILHLHDPAQFPSTTLAGKLAGANRALTGGDIAISLTGTTGRFDDAMAAIGLHFRPGGMT